MKKFYLLIFSIFISNLMLAQESSVRKVINSYDVKSLNELELKYKNQWNVEMKRAQLIADSLGLSKDIATKSGHLDQLVGLIGNDNLKYYSVDNNTTAAASTRTNYLNNSYSLYGAGLTVGVWDGGPVRTSHQEFGGRSSIGDGTVALNSNSFHATHVSGTIGASGVNAPAKGMAPQVTLKGFDWFNDVSEVIAQGKLGMLVSNHSYGVPVASAPAWYIGSYSNDSRDWDEVAFNLPYYLMVASAGNNGQDSNPSPLATGYDKLTGNKTSKNNLVIANTQQASIDANGNLTAVAINSSSSQGPTDDRRIKPDISGQGSGLLSCGDATNSSYITLSGTSMSAPNVSGTLILLQEFFERKNNRYMKAATLKGLVCHSADDAGLPGPDAIFGWGLLNAKKAAELILLNGLSSSIVESTINQNQTIVYKFKSDGTPFKASICWTDPAGNAVNGILNGSTAALVNDLDVRITAAGNQEFFPWRLQTNPALNALRTGDNNVDNVESVLIDAPTLGTEYTITITHKGNLRNDLQNFSLIVSGINSTFSLLPLNTVKEVCSTSNAVYNLDFKNVNFSSVALQATNLPAGAIATFSPPSVVVETVVGLTISNLQNVPAGEYFINVVATKGTEVKNIILTLKVFSSVFQDTALLFPGNNANNVASNTEFRWAVNVNASSYKLQIANDAAFQNIFVNETVEETSLLVNNLALNQAYYWRVLPINLCGAAVTSGSARTFSTANNVCGTVFIATDFSTNVLSASNFAEAVVPINVTENFVISDLTVNFNITHPAVQELKIFLEGPASIGSPSILLVDQSCGNFPNVNGSVNDNAAALACNSTSSPAISGTFKPAQPLSYLNNKLATGTWKLRVTDGFEGNGGTVNDFSLSFCKAETSLGTDKLEAASVVLYPNPTKNAINVVLTNSFLAKSTNLSIIDLNGRVIKTQKLNNAESSVDVSSLQAGVYFVQLESEGQFITKKFIKM